MSSKHRLLRLLCIGLSALTASACAVSAPRSCGAGAQPAVVDTLYFGTRTPDGLVSDADWQRFVDAEVTPRFPQGLTSWTAQGQWRMADGHIERETSHVLQLIHADSTAVERSILALSQQYRRRFQQEAVLRLQTPGCMSF